MSRVRSARLWRIIAAACLVLDLLAFAYNVSRGNDLLFFNALAAAISVIAIRVNTRVIRRQRVLDRPRPDYSAIARMERELYGETFKHDGAPATGGIRIIGEFTITDCKTGRPS